MSNQDAKQADSEAGSIDFATLYQQQLPRIYRYLRARTSSPDEAADLAQQVFLKAIAALPTYQARGAPIDAWLFRIARNVAIDASRRNRPSISLELLTDVEHLVDVHGPEEAVIQAESVQQLATLVSQLDEADRELLLFRFAVGLTTKEIGTIVGKRQGAVRKQLQRILRRMKEHEHVE